MSVRLPRSVLYTGFTYAPEQKCLIIWDYHGCLTYDPALGTTAI